MLEQLKKDLETKSFQIKYEDGSGVVTTRLITPLTLVHNRRSGWGVLAWCHKREAGRWFIVDRIQHVDPVDRAKEFTPQELMRIAAEMDENQAIQEAARMEEKKKLAESPLANDYYLIADQKSYTHDCEQCVFLGHIDEKDATGEHKENYDLYVCRGMTLMTVIARYADEGSHYMSGLEIAKAILKNNPERAKKHPLVIAMAIAHKKGLLTKKELDG